MISGAQALMESLKREHVDHMFGYAGATICPAVDALAHTDIAYTLVRTEQNAGHMASGYARMTGKPGVCMVTSGPGATNLITGIATAYMDSIPLVAITGQVQSYLLGRDIFQEVDITGAVAPFIKHSYLVKDANDIPRMVKEAFHIASTGRQGPVLIDVPVDIQEQMIEPKYPDSVDIRGYMPSVRGNELQIKKVAQAISASHRPLLCAGGGLFSAGAREELLALCESAGLPVVTTMMGLSLLPTGHPLNMGMIGAHGNVCANKALAKADLLIMVGTVFAVGPAGLIVTLIQKGGIGGILASTEFWLWIILAYYFIATFLSIDKIIGRVYPLFGICLIIMALGVIFGIFTNSAYGIPEIWEHFGNMHPAGTPVWSVMFITVACGAISGFHSTQSPLMARCMKSERQGHFVFYGAMVAEGVIALIWAAAGCSLYEVTGGLSTGLSAVLGNGQSAAIYDVCARTMGGVGIALAMVGVIVCPITSGDTAFRSARLVLADWFKINQSEFGKRLMLCVPLLFELFMYGTAGRVEN